MHPSSLLVQMFAAAFLVSALPTPGVILRSPPTQLPSQIHNWPPRDWRCVTNRDKGTTRTYPADYIRASVEYGLELRDNGDNPAGNSKYPDWIQDPSKIPGLEGYKGAKNIDHFPLNYDTKTVFTGGKPTSDARVFYQHDVNSPEATFLGVWSHEGMKGKEFWECEEL